MNEAMRTREPWRTTAMVLIAVLVLLVVALASMLRPAATTGVGGRSIHPGVHVTSAAGQGIAGDSYVERHTEVVAGYQQGGPR
jgi:hypothetical protein